MNEKYARVLIVATEVLGNKERAERWMNTPQKLLGFEIPNKVLESEGGEKDILNILQQIEHSVYA